MKKLYRSTKDSQVSGVLGGVSEMYGIDVSLLRILLVVSGFFTGGMTWLIYIIAAIVMPTDKQI
ncbi:PspC domain-containing protein [Halobacillus sp. ACCC02827]|uniref:PspC domain-containing protein n=1 Tax=Bacillaceae TaxID=186817 RepID=UPI0002DCBE52|nr:MULTISPECIES: PspC domain-containing protein [Bacillaceae]QHT46278.1 PspC domain-containing protein [Bacillus sp. SB49]WJE17099.1 PspC domain-containing protein [Halobacillus sp. ACCC02827]